MKKISVVALLLSATISFAQKKTNPVPYAHSITAADLKKQLYIIAGPEMEGRATGTEGQRKAAEYIEKEFKRIGILPGDSGRYQQNFTMYYHDSLEKGQLTVNNQAFHFNKDFSMNMNTYRETETDFSEVIFVGQRAGDAIKNKKLKGKLVILLPKSTAPTSGTSSGQSIIYTLEEKGAAAILMVNDHYTSGIRDYPKLFPDTTKGRSLRPLHFSISEAIAKAIAKEDYETAKQNPSFYKSYKVNLSLNTKRAEPSVQSNVIGIIEGTDLKNEYLFITAHYDHEGKKNNSVIYHGADDNGSGTVGVLEIAEAFAKAKAEGKGPRRTIVFILFSGEEQGLLGSEYFVSNPVFPLEKASATLNMDMIGRIDPKKKVNTQNYVYVIGDHKLSSDLRPISESANKQYTSLQLDYKYNDPKDKDFLYSRSDHYSFAKAGVPSIFYFSGLHPDYHKPTDTPNKINYQLLSKRAQLVFYTAWGIANRNNLLKRDLAPVKPPLETAMAE